MTKKANRKAISKQKSKKVTKKPSHTQFQVSLKEFNRLYALLEEEKNKSESLRNQLADEKKHSNWLQDGKQFWINLRTSDVEQLEKKVEAYHSSFIQSTDHFLDFLDKTKQLRKDFNALLLNYDPEQAKERIKLCENLQKDIEKTTKENEERVNTIKQVQKDITEQLRKMQERKEAQDAK